MWLVDTSVWIQHFRANLPDLRERLIAGRVLMHPAVAGELACGNLANREELLANLHRLPATQVATDSEAVGLIETRKLWGRGLGWVDVQLIASALLSHCALWTLDKRLADVANEMGLK